MPVSGSTDFTLNTRDLVTFALRKIRVVDGISAPSADDMENGRQQLNLMLKSWQAHGPNLWRQTEGTLTLTTAASYALTAAYRVVSARLRQSGRDLPMGLMTREEYREIPLKTSTGTPTQYYFDPQRDGGTLYIWPLLATAAGETIEYTYQRRFDDNDTLTNSLDIPQEYLETVGYNLAARLIDDHGIIGVVADRITARAAELKQRLEWADVEPVLRMGPG